VPKMDRTASKSINKRILKNGDIPGDKCGDIPGDTTTWGYPLLITYLSPVGDIPGISPEGIFANTINFCKFQNSMNRNY